MGNLEGLKDLGKIFERITKTKNPR